jgi:hypothetical protein
VGAKIGCVGGRPRGVHAEHGGDDREAVRDQGEMLFHGSIQPANLTPGDSGESSQSASSTLVISGK